MKRLPRPTFHEEQLLWSKRYNFVAGIDEVGRGAFAGPLVTAAVIFPKNCVFLDNELENIHDSKLLTPQKRLSLAKKIKEVAVSFSVQEISVTSINRFGIGKAAQVGFIRAVKSLRTLPDFCLVDAFWIRGLRKRAQKPIIHGDSLSISIAAASIIAKVHRDELMTDLSAQYPNYDFATHKGYGTKLHRERIKEFGLSPQHRISFNLSAYIPISSST